MSILRLLARVGLATAIVFLLALAIVPVVLVPTFSGGLAIAVIVVIPVAVVVAARRLRWAPWTPIAVGYAALVPVLAYLALDDRDLRHPANVEELSPAFPGAEKSYGVLMQYGKNHPLGKDFRAPSRMMTAGLFVDAAKPAEWPKWLTTHRSEVEADWAELAPVRVWWDELTSFDRIADLTPLRVDAEIIAFAPIRSYSMHASAIAGLQALDGR